MHSSWNSFQIGQLLQEVVILALNSVMCTQRLDARQVFAFYHYCAFSYNYRLLTVLDLDTEIIITKKLLRMVSDASSKLKQTLTGHSWPKPGTVEACTGPTNLCQACRSPSLQGYARTVLTELRKGPVGPSFQI